MKALYFRNFMKLHVSHVVWVTSDQYAVKGNSNTKFHENLILFILCGFVTYDSIAVWKVYASILENVLTPSSEPSTSKLRMETACSCKRMVYTYYITTLPESICRIYLILLRLANYHVFQLWQPSPYFWHKNLHLGGFFRSVEMSGFWDLLLLKLVSSAVDLLMSWKTFFTKILYNLNSENTLKENHTQNFIPMEVKKTISKEMQKELHKDCDKFCAGIKCMCNMCTEYLNKWTKPMADLSCFMSMTLSKPPNQNDAEPSIHFLINNGVPIDDAKCSDQYSHLKKMHGNLPQWRRVQYFVSTPEVDQLFWELKRTAENLKVLLWHSP